MLSSSSLHLTSASGVVLAKVVGTFIQSHFIWGCPAIASQKAPDEAVLVPVAAAVAKLGDVQDGAP